MENKCHTFSCVVSGDICQQFTKEMFDMYQGFAFYKNWDFEVLNYTPAEYGKVIFVFLYHSSIVPAVFPPRVSLLLVPTHSSWD